MADTKEMPGYMTYREAALMFALMPEAEAAAAIRATANYFLYGKEAELTEAAADVFKIMKSSIDRGRETYNKKVEGGRRGGLARVSKNK